MKSTSGRSTWPRNCRAYADSDSTYRRWPSAKIVSNASDDLPLPDSPVNTTSASRGISTDTSRRLCTRAPWTLSRELLPTREIGTGAVYGAPSDSPCATGDSPGGQVRVTMGWGRQGASSQRSSPSAVDPVDVTAVRYPWRTRRLGWTALVVGVGLVGFAVRFALLWRSGPLSLGGYDDGVHFAAAVNLVHGRLPYRDVLFLQPPGILLAMSPFAAVAQVIGDAKAFALARIAFTVIGGLNAALVTAILRRFGVPAAVVGGAVYALSFAAVYAERTATLEALATTGVLLAILLIPHARDLEGGPWYLIAGAAAGAAIGFKIWYVVAFGVLLLWARGGRLRVLTGGVIACLVIYGPFFSTAPAQMFRDIVSAQLGRPDLVELSTTVRLRSMLGISGLRGPTPIPPVPADLILAVLLGVVAVLVAATLFERRARVFVVLLAASAAVLLIAPSYYQHYATFTAGPLALIGGVGTARIVTALPRRWPQILVVALVVAAVVGLNARHDQGRAGFRAPVAALRAAADQVHGCLVSDDPGLLAVLNRLTPQVVAGCDVQPDPSGQGYVLPYPDDVAVLRIEQPAFQREIVRYLHSGSAWISIRGVGLGLTPATAAAPRSDDLPRLSPSPPPRGTKVATPPTRSSARAGGAPVRRRSRRPRRGLRAVGPVRRPARRARRRSAAARRRASRATGSRPRARVGLPARPRRRPRRRRRPAHPPRPRPTGAAPPRAVRNPPTRPPRRPG